MAPDFHPRSAERPSDSEWMSTLDRIRSEFDEMPCLRVTQRQARSLFGLSESLSQLVLDHLSREGFLEKREEEYVRRNAQP